MKLELDIAISEIPFLSAREKIILRNNIDSLDALAVLSIEDIEILVGRAVKTRGWDGKQNALIAEKSAKIMGCHSINGCVLQDEHYPFLLKEITDPPYMIFYRGNLNALEKECVSVVGTRKVCPEGAEFALTFSKEAAESGLCVVSGLAYGIDSFSHKGALQSGINGSTCAVIPGGIDTVVPYGNKRLALKILDEGGVILSEYPPGYPVERWCFVQRNRLIAALSPATVVVQAHAGSGAMLTADFAVGYNRELVFSKACFCSQEQKIAEMELLKNSNNLKKTSPKSYVMEGAPVIEDFSDFIKIRSEGVHFPEKNNFGQLELF